MKFIKSLFLIAIASQCFAQEMDSVKVTKHLKKGWNLIAYNKPEALPVDYALADIWDKVESIKDFEHFYSADLQLDANSIDSLFPGNGYMLKVSDSCIMERYILQYDYSNCNTFTVPSAISPHSCFNNEFKITYQASCTYFNSFSLEIFNNLGQSLFVTDTPTTGWDGTFEGNPVPAGSYIWKISAVFSNGTTWTNDEGKNSGSFMIIR